VSVDRYKGFVFNPADLAEDVDLDEERRKAILYAEANLSAWTHYDVLGLPWNAGADAARSACKRSAAARHSASWVGHMPCEICVSSYGSFSNWKLGWPAFAHQAQTTIMRAPPGSGRRGYRRLRAARSDGRPPAGPSDSGRSGSTSGPTAWE